VVAVDIHNSLPVANAGPDRGGRVGDVLTLDGSASSDADQNPLGYRWALLSRPPGSQATLADPTAAQCMLAPDVAGDYVAQLIVNDGHADSVPPDTARISVTPNHAPEIASAPVTAATVGQLYSYAVTATDPDSDPLSYSLTASPAGMIIDPLSGLIHWTPGPADAGTRPVTVKVADGRGGQALQPFDLAVAPAAAAQTLVPALTGLSRPAAEAALQAAQLTLGPLDFRHDAAGEGTVLGQSVAAGASVALGAAVGLTVSLGPDIGLPPSPETVAPPLDPTVPTTVDAATGFLYGGDNPIQTGVAEGAIEPQRAAVLRGRVRDPQDAPLPGVTVTVLNHPEFGQTLSRADGGFDLAVNGGTSLTLDFRKAGYLPVQRQADVPWQDYVAFDDAVLVPLDAQATAVDLADTAQPFQVAQGSPVTDADGTRQATVLFPRGLQATLILPNGDQPPLTTLHVRATEYTVGANGPAALPGPLPPASGYTYAIELSVDEAIAAGATRVDFDQAVPFYVENFLGFPVGQSVPVGWYDRVQGSWIPSANGKVIQILGVTGGLADLDITGDGVADDATPLGITPDERAELAARYAPGQSLWRAPIPHFTPWDLNWPRGLPRLPAAPKLAAPLPNSGALDTERKEDCATEAAGSIIECENQVLGERLPVAGTALTLNYRSDRAPGRKTAATVEIPLTGASFPADLRRIDLRVAVAGRTFEYTYATPTANLSHTFTWDGLDAYGRRLYGAQTATVRIGYVYDAAYYPPAATGPAFGQPSGSSAASPPARQPLTAWQERRAVLEATPVSAGQGLAGWTLDVLHGYDPTSRTLAFGDGRRRSGTSEFGVIDTVAGTGTASSGGDGGPAGAAQLNNPRSFAVAPDGSLYVAEASGHRVRRIGPDGIITTVAGNGNPGWSGDGGPADQATLNNPSGLALGPDGSLYIAEFSSHRVRRVGPDGIITTVAGTGNSGGVINNISATSANVSSPSGLALGPDGSLYISEGTGSHRVRRVGPDGIITTLAGNGLTTYNGDNRLATTARLNAPRGLALGPDGSLYIAEFGNHRVRRIGPDGIITTVAGTGTGNWSGDGGLATAAQINQPYGVALGPDGSLYIADYLNHRLRQVTPDGIITTVAGTGQQLYGGDGSPAAAAPLRGPQGVAMGQDGSLYIADFINNRVRRIRPVFQGLADAQRRIASEDGSEVYEFSPEGRHLQTLDALTGAVRLAFAYDADGRLATLTDGDGNVVTVERDALGRPTALAAPDGQRTVLTLDPNGYLATAANPAGDTYRMSYTGGGLLSTFEDPNGHASAFVYDPDGRLIEDRNALNDSQTLARTPLTNRGYEVALGTAEGRTTRHRVEPQANGDRWRTAVDPAGFATVRRIQTSGTTTVTAPDNSILTTTATGDPRFGMQAPLAKSLTVQTGGLTATRTAARSVVLADPADPLSLTTLTDTVTVNGRPSTTVYDALTRTVTATSAAGRTASASLDALGRPLTRTAPGLHPVQHAYDPRGRLTDTTAGPAGGLPGEMRAVHYDYYASGPNQGALQAVTDPLDRRVRFEYDLAGRLTRQILPDSREVLYGYDAKGNLASLTPPGQPAHLFQYTAVDQTDQYEPPLAAPGGHTVYSYNRDRDLTLVTRPDGATVGFAYDSAGRLFKVTTPEGETTYGYSAATGQLATVTAPDGGVLGYTYSGALLTQVQWNVAGTVGYAYDTDFRVTELKVNGADPIAYGYDADSLLTSAGALTLSRDAQTGFLTGTTLGQAADSLAYTGFGEVDSYAATVNGSPVFAVAYASRDKLGRIVRKTETVQGTATTYDYGYDTAGRLAEVKRDGVTTATYGYDANGNRTTVNGVTVATYDSQDRLLTYNGTSYAYTANGELQGKTVGGQSTGYRYDVFGNLRHVDLPGGTQLDYLIDGQNRRIGKKINGSLVQGFLYQDGLRIIAELDGANQVVSRLVYADKGNVPAYLIKGGNTYRIVSDHLGSPRLVVNTATGAVVQRLDYDEWGRVTGETNAGFQPFGYAGGLYDRDTGLVRFGARDYDPETGRWTAKDPIGFGGTPLPTSLLMA
jgi:RHS repeat-associated protein